MPSPVGHMLAGIAVAWTVDPRADRRLLATAAALAAVPDVDLLLPVRHRAMTHSVIAVVLVTIIAAVVTRQVTMRRRWQIALICGLAFGSHLLLDWLGSDPVFPHGVQALWPFSDQFFISGWGIFRPTLRNDLLNPANIVRNVAAVLQEAAILGTVVYAVWLVRVKTLARLPAKLTRRDHAAQ